MPFQWMLNCMSESVCIFLADENAGVKVCLCKCHVLAVRKKISLNFTEDDFKAICSSQSFLPLKGWNSMALGLLHMISGTGGAAAASSHSESRSTEYIFILINKYIINRITKSVNDTPPPISTSECTGPALLVWMIFRQGAKTQQGWKVQHFQA